MIIKINMQNFPDYKQDIIKLMKTFDSSLDDNYINNMENYIADGSALICGHLLEDKLVSLVWSYIRIFNNEKRVHISYFVVDKNYRGKNFANSLISFIIKECQKKSISKIDLNVDPDNKNAIKAYLKSGFVIEKLQLSLRVNGDE